MAHIKALAGRVEWEGAAAWCLCGQVGDRRNKTPNGRIIIKLNPFYNKKRNKVVKKEMKQ
jgi:hypothetical protein